MKKLMTFLVVAVFAAMALVVTPVYAEGNPIDKVGDWWATRGKEDPEKTAILTQRQAARAAKKAEKEMQKGMKEMQQGMKDAKKGFGK